MQVIYSKGRLHHFYKNFKNKKYAIKVGVELIKSKKATHFLVIPSKSNLIELWVAIK